MKPWLLLVLTLVPGVALAGGDTNAWDGPLVVLVDSREFAAQALNNFLGVTFTRSEPASDVLGVGRASHRKHFGCRGPLVIDARPKPHMAPPLEEDPAVTKRVDALAAGGGPLHGIIE